MVNRTSSGRDRPERTGRSAAYQLLLAGQPPLVVPLAERSQERVTVPSVALAIENLLFVFEVTVSVYEVAVGLVTVNESFGAAARDCSMSTS